MDYICKGDLQPTLSQDTRKSDERPQVRTAHNRCNEGLGSMVSHEIAEAEPLLKKIDNNVGGETKSYSNNQHTSLTLPQTTNSNNRMYTARYMSVLELYYKIIYYGVITSISQQAVRIFRMLNLIVGESEDIQRKEYASYTLDGFKIVLAYGNLLRFSIINSGNLELYAKEEAEKRSLTQAECAEHLFRMIKIGRSNEPRDDILGLSQALDSCKLCQPQILRRYLGPPRKSLSPR